MLICVDVGNSSTSYGIYQGKRLVRSGSVPTYRFPVKIKELISYGNSIPNTHILITSVVPKITQIVTKSIGESKGTKLWIVGRNFKVQIRHKYRHYNRLGSDRIINAFGATRLYKPPLLILDYGTALTCDYISGRGVFLGGLILPGPEISLMALSQKAALLPKIPFPTQAKGFLGRDTREGMKSGILQGYGALTDGLVDRFKRKYGKRVRVVATGGLAKTIARYSTGIDRVDPLLTLKSLRQAFQECVKLPS